jgi:hypothetical protein
MATFTITTDTNIDELVGKTGGDSYIVRSGATLTIDQDSRYGLNQSVSASVGNFNYVDAQYGMWRLDARKVRLIPFNNGIGTLPALNSIVSQGGAQGKLIGVWTSLSAAPVTSGAMPASGYIKIKQWNDIPYAAGALTLSGVTANATGSDVVGWLEMVFDSNGYVTASSLNTIQAYGEWYEVGVTTGTRSSTYQLPTSGSLTNIGGVWVESSAGSGVYERYPNIQSAAGLTTIATDAVRGQWCWITTAGVLRLGNDGTNDSGYCPPAGCKIRIPNLILQTCSTAARTLNIDQTTISDYNSTFQLSGGYCADFDKVSVGFAYRETYSNATLVVKNSSFIHSYGARAQYARGNTDNVIIGSLYAGAGRALRMAYDYVGHIINNLKFAVHNSCASWYGAADFSKSKNIEMDNIHGGTIIKRTADDRALLEVVGGANISIRNSVLGGGPIAVNSMSGLTVDNVGYYDNVQGDVVSSSVGVCPIVHLGDNTDTVSISDLHFNGLTNAHCYNAMVKVRARANSVKIRNIGTFSNPINCGTVNPCRGIWMADYNANSGPYDIKRCYSINARAELTLMDSAPYQIAVKNFNMPYTTTFQVKGVDNNMYAIRGTLNSTVYSAQNNSGSHFLSMFTSDTAGLLLFSCVPLTPISSQYITVSSASAVLWTGTKAYFRANTYGWFEIECPEWIKGFTSFQAANVSTDAYPFNVTDYTVKFQIDTGSGYNGSWLLATSANLTAYTFDPAVGFKIKIRIDQVVTTATNVGVVKFLLNTSLAAQEAGLYPLDVSTLQINNAVAGSAIKVQKVSDNSVLYTGTATSIAVEYAGDVKITLRNASGSPAYQEWITQTTLVSGETTTVTALQQLDQ